MSQCLFLDDERFPPERGQAWNIVRSSREAIEWCERHGAPSFISFDHDLGGDDTALKVVHWLIDRDLDAAYAWLPEDFDFVVHSQNPVGAQNIEGLLRHYLTFRESHRSSAPAPAKVPRW